MPLPSFFFIVFISGMIFKFTSSVERRGPAQTACRVMALLL